MLLANRNDAARQELHFEVMKLKFEHPPLVPFAMGNVRVMRSATTAASALCAGRARGAFAIIKVMLIDTGFDRILIEDHNGIGELAALPRLHRSAIREARGKRQSAEQQKHFAKSAVLHALLHQQGFHFFHQLFFFHLREAGMAITHHAFFVDQNRRGHALEIEHRRNPALRIANHREAGLRFQF